MAAVSAWGKPGAWALDAEEHDAAAAHKDSATAAVTGHNPSDEFPSLAAAATKTKKKKAQTLSLAEFNTGRQAAVYRAPSSRAPAANEILELPTGPRERTAEELERVGGGGGRGFGYSTYGGRGGREGGADASRVSDESRRGGAGGGFNRDSGPSRADETDDWGATKRSVGPAMERRERGGGGFFGDSQSRADDSDSWISNKPASFSSEGRRMSGGGGFDGPRERRGGFEMFKGEGLNGGGGGGGVDSDAWGKRREEPNIGGGGGGGRPRLALQPRTQPLANNNNNNNPGEQPGSTVRSKGSNPFGEARPREEVLKEKGQDWKEIDEKLESMKIREAPPEGQQLGRKNELGGAPEDRTEKAWRKPDTVEASRVEKPDEVPGN